MNPTPESSLHRRAQQGKSQIKDAIAEFLESQSERWLKRTEIEGPLGLTSAYSAGSNLGSYDGAFSAMLLDELVEERRILRERHSDGRTWIYRAA
jgi:hypothetical protein